MSRPKVGLALGSGAARGLAHIGVLKVLEREGIPIDMIAGSSMGSLIGTVYANGGDLAMMEQLAIHLKRNQWLDFSLTRRGLVAGDRIRELVRLLTHGKNLEDLQIPTAVIATDLTKGERVVFTSGPIDLAVRASVSIPGIFEPVEWEGRTLVDGGVIDRVPVSVVREMGADVVIAVDVISPTGGLRIRNIFDVIAQSLEVMERQMTSPQILTADVVLHPELSDISPTAFTRVDVCIRRGEEVALAQLEAIRRAIGEAVPSGKGWNPDDDQ
ncbi:MAG: patatin-like phospholipase family protein [Planifilum sp.]